MSLPSMILKFIVRYRRPLHDFKFGGVTEKPPTSLQALPPHFPLPRGLVTRFASLSPSACYAGYSGTDHE